MRIGIDVDGVLAEFQEAFVQQLVAATGKDLYPQADYATRFPCWAHPQAHGYTDQEESLAWERITYNRMFWATLPPYSTTASFLAEVTSRLQDDFYFITARPGIYAKRQTEEWLARYTPWCKSFEWTVLVSPHKGLCAQALSLDRYLDDKWENAESVGTTNTASYLLDRPWNQREIDVEDTHVIRIYHPSDIFRD